MSAAVELLIDDEDAKVPDHLRGAFAVLRRGIRESPELRRGLGFTVIVSLGVTVASLVTPVLVQQIFDKGFTPTFNARFVYTRCAAAFVLVLVAFVAARAAGRRLVTASENALMHLRVRTFRHIHALSIAEQSEEKRGVFVARVTADVDALQEFMEWGGIAWIISGAEAVGALGLMLWYSWQLATAVLLLLIPLLVVVWSMQAKLTAAFNAARTRVGEMLSEVSESVMGAAVVRAYGLDEQTHGKVERAISERYKAEVLAHFRAATFWPMSSIFYALALSTVIVLGSVFGRSWGLTFGQVSAFLFLADVFLHVFTDLPEIYSETQQAIAGWRKILAVLDIPIEVVEPLDGVTLPHGALSVEADGVRYRYRDGPEVLHGITLSVPAGGHLPVVDAASRRARIRMVPQDGFLFAASVRENVRYGREEATDREIDTAFSELGLSDWVASLPDGLETVVGERGEALSVGERQLVALARAHISDPGLLILDEATSAVDPATERRITEALRRLSAGRTVVTIAHRLSTAEGAERVFVFDAGRLVEEGTHRELVTAGGRYAALYRSWLGNVREGEAEPVR
jgi:ATP-binding cassette subfamily B protein